MATCIHRSGDGVQGRFHVLAVVNITRNQQLRKHRCDVFRVLSLDSATVESSGNSSLSFGSSALISTVAVPIFFPTSDVEVFFFYDFARM